MFRQPIKSCRDRVLKGGVASAVARDSWGFQGLLDRCQQNWRPRMVLCAMTSLSPPLPTGGAPRLVPSHHAGMSSGRGRLHTPKSLQRTFRTESAACGCSAPSDALYQPHEWQCEWQCKVLHQGRTRAVYIVYLAVAALGLHFSISADRGTCVHPIHCCLDSSSQAQAPEMHCCSCAKTLLVNVVS